MTTKHLHIKKNIYGKIEDFQLLITPMKDKGFCSGCEKVDQNLYLTLVKRIKEIKGKNKGQFIDNPLQYCYDCASTELTKLSKANVSFQGLEKKQKQDIISSILGEMAHILQREKGNMIDENGNPLPNKYELFQQAELLRQKTEKKNKDKEKEGKVSTKDFKENDYVFDMDKQRDELMDKTEQINQEWERKYGKLPFTPRYRSAFYAPNNRDKTLETTKESLEKVKEKKNYLDKKTICSECREEIPAKFVEETDQIGEGVKYCFECHEKARKGIFRCHEFGCKQEINTRKGDIMFALDLNHNVFC